MAGGPEVLHFALMHITGSRKGQEERFASSRITIGRGRGNECGFDPEHERSVSHRHCEIRIEDGTPVIYDIGSLNGTYLNGRRVRRSPVADGDEIGLGREGPRLRFLLRSGATPAAILPGEMPAVIAGTSTEARPSGLEERMRAEATQRRLRIALAGTGALAALGLGAWIATWLHLGSRIRDLESFRTPGAETPAPAAADFDVEGPGWALVLQHRHRSGRVLMAREIACVMPVAPGRVLVPRAPIDLVERDLALGSSQVAVDLLLVVLGPTGPLPVTGILAGTGEAADLAVLEFGGDSSILPSALPPEGHFEREALARQPGLAPRRVAVTALTRADGRVVENWTEAAYLRLRDGPALPGVPLFASGGFIGIVMGESTPGLALPAHVAARAAEAILAQPVRPLRRGG
jgi:hypothetical protein